MTDLFWKEYNFDTAFKVLKNQEDINPDVCVITTPECDKINLKEGCKAICFSKQVNTNDNISYPMTYERSGKWNWEY